MRAVTTLSMVLLLAACGREVEPQTVETPEEEVAAEKEATTIEPVADVGSAYTEIDECKVTEEGHEEMPFVTRRCEGHAGYSLVVTTSDLRDSVTLVTPEGEEEPLDFNGQIAEGAFNNLGKTVEWRGADPEHPRVLIARMNVANEGDPMAADTSYLAVVKLESPACIIARVPPGPGQNVAARRFADRETLPACLKTDEVAADD